MATKTAAQKAAERAAKKAQENSERETEQNKPIATAAPKSAGKKSAVETMIDNVPSSGKITVACKMPKGIIMRIFTKGTMPIPVLGGGIQHVEQSIPTGEQVRLNGYAVPFGKRPKFEIIGDFGLTPGVDAKFFKTWLEQNKTSDLVTKGLVFYHQDTNQVRDMADERQELQSGLEPILQDKDPRAARTRNPNLEDVHASDEAPR